MRITRAYWKKLIELIACSLFLSTNNLSNGTTESRDEWTWLRRKVLSVHVSAALKFLLLVTFLNKTWSFPPVTTSARSSVFIVYFSLSFLVISISFFIYFIRSHLQQRRCIRQSSNNASWRVYCIEQQYRGMNTYTSVAECGLTRSLESVPWKM